MIINTSKLTAAELTEIEQDLSKILTEKESTGAAFLFWHEILKQLIRENDLRILTDLDNDTPGK